MSTYPSLVERTELYLLQKEPAPTISPDRLRIIDSSDGLELDEVRTPEEYELHEENLIHLLMWKLEQNAGTNWKAEADNAKRSIDKMIPDIERSHPDLAKALKSVLGDRVMKLANPASLRTVQFILEKALNPEDELTLLETYELLFLQNPAGPDEPTLKQYREAHESLYEGRASEIANMVEDGKSPIVIGGCMYAGKSTLILKAAKELEAKGYKAEYLTSFALGEDKIVARALQTKVDATQFGGEDSEEIVNSLIDKASRVKTVIILDEFSFVNPAAVDLLIKKAKEHNIPLVMLGLDYNFIGAELETFTRIARRNDIHLLNECRAFSEGLDWEEDPETQEKRLVARATEPGRFIRLRSGQSDIFFRDLAFCQHMISKGRPMVEYIPTVSWRQPKELLKGHPQYRDLINRLHHMEQSDPTSHALSHMMYEVLELRHSWQSLRAMQQGNGRAA